MSTIKLDQIKNRVEKGLIGKTPLNGDRITVASFGKDFSDKAREGLSELAHSIVHVRNKKDIVKSETDKEDNMSNIEQREDEEPTI